MPKIKYAGLRHKILDQLLRNNMRRYSAAELLEELEEKTGKPISKSSFDKDIKFLRDQGAPIIVKDGKYYYSDRNFSIDQHPLSEEDKSMLDFAFMILKAFKGSSIFQKFDTTIDRILTGSRLGRIFGKESLNCIQIEEPTTGSGQQWLETIYEAILQKKSLHITYQKFGQKPESRNLSPYLLKEYRNRWYVAGHSEESKETRVFALDRIVAVEKGSKPFVEDKTFNPDDYFQYSLGVHHFNNANPELVELEFYPPVIDFILSEKIHHSQKEILSDDGKILRVSLNVYISPELEMMILSYGPGVKVITPERLVHSISKSIKESLKFYH